jgi:ZIP family zinc transporter
MPDNDLPNDRRSISGGSNAVSMTTNNIGEASIQDLLSNTSIHRMHVVAETASNYIENVSHVSISLMNENEDGFSLNPSLRTQSIPNGDVHSRISGPSLQRRASYEEMLEQQQEVMAQEEEEETPTDQFREVTDILGTNVNRLKRMGILTGLAIALHNFPEGLATFVATLSDPAFGGALALAIALHNIPEGICVSMPVYYATGSRIKAFLWAFLSGVSEPLGALLGWLILQNLFGPIVYGISFGMISGMMVYISLKELLPTAHKFDKTNGILTTVFLVIGMVIMSLSLVLFAYR